MILHNAHLYFDFHYAQFFKNQGISNIIIPCKINNFLNGFLWLANLLINEYTDTDSVE